ncbi:MAG: universal stress protein [Gammaproteobacteria bacterium]|nr:universal stress protein [Gammaproteobacteria bacterium]
MAEPLRILGCTDFSPAGDRALRRAALLAAQTGAALHLLHVLPPGEVMERLLPAAGTDGLRAHADRGLQERAQRFTAELGVTATCELRQGRAHQEILRAIEGVGAHLAVLGAQGERAALMPPSTIGGSVFEVVERARVAILLVRREAGGDYAQVLACAKGVASDRAVLAWADRLSPGELIQVVSAYDVPYARRLTEWGATDAAIDAYAARERDRRAQHVGEVLDGLGIPAARARQHIERGEAVKTILMSAARWQADLVVVARRAYAAFLVEGPFGSVAREVAVLAPMDVLVVPPVS